jgi:hypothetical protein
LLTDRSLLVINLGQAVRTHLVDGLLANLLQDVILLRVYLVCYRINYLFYRFSFYLFNIPHVLVLILVNILLLDRV